MDDAVNYARAGKHAEALKLFTELMDSSVDKTPVLGHRAWLYRQMADYEKSIADYKALLSARVGDVEVKILLAETYLLNGDIHDAINLLLEVLTADKGSIRAFDLLRKCYEKLGWHQDATPGNSININDVIDRLSGDKETSRAAICPEIGALLYSLVRTYRPGIVVEAGSHIGYSSICIAQALKDNGHGHLHAYDLFINFLNYRSPITGGADDMLTIASEHVHQADLDEFVTFYKGDSSRNIKTTLKKLGLTIDLAFIDGDHRIAGCLKDWREVDELLNKNGIVVVHDINPNQAQCLGPRYLMDNIAKNGNYMVVNITTHDGSGLGIIQKVQEGNSEIKMPGFGTLVYEWFFNQTRPIIMHFKKNRDSRT